MRAIALALLCATGCSAPTVLWLEVKAPFVVPDACDSLQVAVSRADGSAAFGQTYDLTKGPQFPLKVSLVAEKSQDVGAPLSVAVAAMKGASLPRSCALETQTVTLKDGQLTPLAIQLCP